MDLSTAPKPNAPKPNAAPPGLRIYAVGDIHGQLALLDRLHGEIEADAAAGGQRESVIVYLGDYIDRGLYSREVVDRLIAGPPPGFSAIHLKGNHEEALLEFLEDPSFGLQWANFGGLETLHSYGVEDAARLGTPRAFVDASNRFARTLPPEHLQFFRTLRLSATLGDYFFAHAGVKPGVALERQSEDDLLWIREEFLDSNADFGKIVVHGHTPSPAPVLRANRIGVDTGAYMTGILTCAVLEDTECRFLCARL